MRLLPLITVLSWSSVSCQLTKVIGDGNCKFSDTDHTRETRCVPKDKVLETCKGICIGAKNASFACRGFSYIDHAKITSDFANCKAKGLGRCDFFFGCDEVKATRKVTDPMICVALQGLPACTTTAVVSDGGGIIPPSILPVVDILLDANGPTLIGWVVFGSAAAVLIIIIISIIACCCCCCKNKTKRGRASFSNMRGGQFSS